MSKSYEERRIFCNNELIRVREIAAAYNMWFILVCRDSVIGSELTSHVYFAENRQDFDELVMMVKSKCERDCEKFKFKYWIDTNLEFVNGGLLDV